MLLSRACMTGPSRHSTCSMPGKPISISSLATKLSLNLIETLKPSFSKNGTAFGTFSSKCRLRPTLAALKGTGISTIRSEISVKNVIGCRMSLRSLVPHLTRNLSHSSNSSRLRPRHQVSRRPRQLLIA